MWNMNWTEEITQEDNNKDLNKVRIRRGDNAGNIAYLKFTSDRCAG